MVLLAGTHIRLSWHECMRESVGLGEGGVGKVRGETWVNVFVIIIC
jgi:hypothetical protein